MKKIAFIFISLFTFYAFTYAQYSSSAYIWQGVIRDVSGAILKNRSLELKVEIRANTTSVRVETHTVETDEQGVALVPVGTGELVSGSGIFYINKYSMTHVCKHIISLKEEDGSYRTLIDEEMPNVPFAEYASSRPSAGTVAIWCGPESTIPPCWSKCDGASLSIPSSNGANKALYDAIGKTWGGDAYSFRRPDMNGVFLRGVDGNAGVDPNKTGRTAVQSGGNTGNAIGSYQSDDFKSHTHTYTDMGTGRADCDDDGADRNFIDVTSTSLYTTSEQANGGTETRPANVAVYYIIYSCSE